jgi:hypothetical protein
MLVTGRSFGDADDVASVLHYRIDRYVTEVGYPSPPATELVVGLFPRPTGITDLDVLLALNERTVAIEQRARTLAEEAIERDDPWVQNFGDPPEPRDTYETWFEEVAAGAAYLDRWEIDEFETNRDDVPASREGQRERLLEAASRARALAGDESSQSVVPFSVSGDDFLESPTTDVTFEL